MTQIRHDAEEKAMEQTTQHVRVAIREVREYAYRALIVAGASPGEATTAAEQVVHAELHAGEGLTGLACALMTGPWPAAPLALTRSRGGMVDVDCADVTSELRLSAVLTDVAVGEPGESSITCASAVAVTSLWDAALLAAAVATGTAVAAIRYDAGAPARVRVARPDGDLWVGQVPAGDVAGSTRTGVAVHTGATPRPPTLEVLACSTAAERAARRRSAAQSGLIVDGATWTVVAARAHQFLVPEVDA
jgi:hypothetical protein